jgi:3-hydroxyacyl-[acyl-carrier-protein] dehydratase
MKFVLVDRIVELTPGERIKTIKNLTLSEEYLADHFPTFPVMPGVLMLEAMTQSAAWLVRVTEDYQHSLVILKEARNVTYKSFVSPGRQLEIEITAKRIDPTLSQFKGVGRCGDQEMVKAQLTLQHLNLSDGDSGMRQVDEKLIEQAQSLYRLLSPANAA